MTRPQNWNPYKKMAAERRPSFYLFKNALIEGVYLCAIILFCEARIFNYLSLFIIRTEHHKAYIHPLLFVAMLLLSICYNVWKYFFFITVSSIQKIVVLLQSLLNKNQTKLPHSSSGPGQLPLTQ